MGRRSDVEVPKGRTEVEFAAKPAEAAIVWRSVPSGRATATGCSPTCYLEPS